MTVAEAYDRLGQRKERYDLLDFRVTKNGLDIWPGLAAAFASVSGALDDAETDADLEEAVEHGKALLTSGVIEFPAVMDDVHRIICLLVDTRNGYLLFKHAKPVRFFKGE